MRMTILTKVFTTLDLVQVKQNTPIENIINQLWENILHQQESLQVVKQMSNCSLEPKIGEKRSVLIYDM